MLKKITALCLGILLLLNGVVARASAEEAVSIYESSLSCGHRIWSDREVASLIKSGIDQNPNIELPARIAGTAGTISTNTANGYYGGVVFGPVRKNINEIEYYYFTIWGDLDRGWIVEPYQKDTLVTRSGRTGYLLLRDGNLEDEFEVNEELALKVIKAEAARLPQNIDSGSLHRFEYLFARLPDRGDVRKQAMEGSASWSFNRYHVKAYLQTLGAHPSVYEGIYTYAVLDDQVRFVEEFSGYNLFDHPDVQREDCSKL